ncbi:MAG TPA: hypothetical protein VF518_11420, partial [Polyangia bacterium]
MSESATRILVLGTFGLLLFASVLTWALVLVKARQRGKSRRQDRRFLAALGTPVKLGVLRNLKDHDGPTWRLSQAGLNALTEVETHDDSIATRRDAVERALQTQIVRERR